MKRTKLILKTETIRRLDGDEMRRVIGGGILDGATHSAAGAFTCTCPRASALTCPSDLVGQCGTIVWTR